MPELSPVPQSASRASTVRLMVSRDANFSGGVSGGQILAEIDRVAYIAATRQSKANCVTASFDRVSFLRPVHVEEVVDFDAELPHVGHPSMEVWVRIRSEVLVGGPPRQGGEAYVAMAAVDAMGRPVPVPALRPESDDGRRRFDEREARMAPRQGTRASRPT